MTVTRKRTISNSDDTFIHDYSHAQADDVREEVPLLDERKAEESTCEKYTSCRWTLTYFGFTLNIVLLNMQQCMSMTLLCLEDAQAKKNLGTVTQVGNGTTGLLKSQQNGSHCSDNFLNPALVFEYIPVDMQGVLLSSYFYGYLFTPFLAGLVAERIGGKRVLTVAMASSAALTLLTPLAIRQNVYLTITFRSVLGFTSGMFIPALMSMWTTWAPVNEKAKLVAIAFSGIHVGTIMANMLSGFLCSFPVDEGWPFIFYTQGFMSVLWTVLWAVMVYDTPDSHPRILYKERNLLAKESKGDKCSGPKTWRLPLKSMFTSVPYLAMLFTFLCNTWVYTFMGTYVPLYLSQILHFNTGTSGALSSLPFLSALLCTWVFAALSDRVTISGLLSVTNNRKLFQAVGTFGPGALLLWMRFLGTDSQTLAVVLLVVLNGLLSAGLTGIILNRLEIAPRYAGTSTGLTITLGTLASILCPLVLSDIISDNRAESWASVFIVSAVIAIVGGVVFLIFASSEEQEWAKDKQNALDMTYTSVTDVKLTSGADTSRDTG